MSKDIAYRITVENIGIVGRLGFFHTVVFRSYWVQVVQEGSLESKQFTGAVYILIIF